MRAVLLSLVSSCVLGGEIIGYNGKQQDGTGSIKHKKKHPHHIKLKSHPHQQHHRVPQQKIVRDAHIHHHYHHLLNKGHKEVKRPTPALDLMRRIAAAAVPSTHHPALKEIVKVANELVASKDEELANATIETFHESLVKLSELTRQDPQVSGPIADMRADVCGSKPDLHAAECDAFMGAYCKANGDKQSCKSYFGEEEEEAEEEKDPEKKEEEKEEKLDKQVQEKDAGPPPEPIPEQGFEGKPVAHRDMETATDDWRREFGPGQPETYETACAEHPDNDWCRSHGYAPLFHRSGAFDKVSLGLGSIAVAVMVRFLVAAF